MTPQEFSDQFDVLYNNITSNDAPGLNEYEKSVFLTKAQDEIIINHFISQSKGNSPQIGFDESQKRQSEYYTLMSTRSSAPVESALSAGRTQICPWGKLYNFPDDCLIVINETCYSSTTETDDETDDDTKSTSSIMIPGQEAQLYRTYSVIPITYSEYQRLMCKPYKSPPKNQVWRIFTNNSSSAVSVSEEEESTSASYVEIIPQISLSVSSTITLYYVIRYIRRPLPIIITDLTDEGVTIGKGRKYYNDEGVAQTFDGVSVRTSELPDNIHEEILSRAVYLAKIAWLSTENLSGEATADARSE